MATPTDSLTSTNRVYLSDVVPVLECTAAEPLKSHARVFEDKFLISQ